nr:MAG TPA: hypothetical protein [Caudoviricetes sp.]
MVYTTKFTIYMIFFFNYVVNSFNLVVFCCFD